MKRYLLTTFIIFLILNILSLIGGFLNDEIDSRNVSAYFFDYIMLKIIFCGIFFLSTFIKSKIDLSLRVPILRTMLWGVFLTRNYFWPSEIIDGDPSDLLHHTNEGICSLYFYFFSFDKDCVGCNFWMGTVFTGLIIFGIFEAAVIKISVKIAEKIWVKAVPESVVA